MVISFLLIAFVILAGISALFWVLNVLSRRRNRASRSDIANLIEQRLQGKTSGWDSFVSSPLSDRSLDAVRVRCLELEDVPEFDRIPEMERILTKLRA